MTQIDVLKMAIEAGLAAETSDGRHQIWYPDNLCHFANLVAAKKQERIIEVVERLGTWAHITEVVAEIKGEA